MQNIMENVNYTLRCKLQSLVSFLSQVNKGIDAVAEEIDNANLKTAMIALAVESKQYAKEISKQLEQFNAGAPTEFTDHVWKQIEAGINEQAGVTKGGEIIALCNNCENYFRKMYDDVLQEYLPYKNLKDIITCQLFALQSAFMKIRLLNTLRFKK
jgi:hypothetical protein